MKYYTVVNEVEALQRAYAVCMSSVLVQCVYVCVCTHVLCAFVAWVGVCLSGGCSDNAAIKKWSLSRESEHVAYVRERAREKGAISVERGESSEGNLEIEVQWHKAIDERSLYFPLRTI